MAQQLIPNLFRTEYGKIVAVLVRSFDLPHVTEAEDIASETFLLAAETWGSKGLPENPTAWLYTVAKNRARDLYRRKGLFRTKIQPDLQNDKNTCEFPTFDFSEGGFKDSQLRMIFALCHPSLHTDTQVALCLRILCGFGIEEIATAFLTTKSTINKRLTRGKARLRTEMNTLELPPDNELPTRMSTVIKTLYLLFNEGYHSTTTDRHFREELCADAIRLSVLLTENKRTNTSDINALLALMCFQASRFQARMSNTGEMIDYDEQDRSLWDLRLIKQGKIFLSRATAKGETGRYQLEAAIAMLHTATVEQVEKWPNILSLYNRLLQVAYSPIAALNRTYAFSRVHGAQLALTEALKIDLRGHIAFHLLLGKLYEELGDTNSAKEHFKQCVQLTKNPSVIRQLEQKILDLV